jgi:hypothetical protein
VGQLWENPTRTPQELAPKSLLLLPLLLLLLLPLALQAVRDCIASYSPLHNMHPQP